jgi:hypothetical protein
MIKLEPITNIIAFVKFDPKFSTTALSGALIWTIGSFANTKP